MKLHLPKTLLVAVLAVCVAPPVWGADVRSQDDIAAGDNTVRTPHIEVSKSLTLSGEDVYFNSWNSGTGQGLIEILTGGSMTVSNDLYSERGTNIYVNGGTLSANTIYMGHHTSASYPGELSMTSGTIIAGAIGGKHANDTNKILITGGTLKITGTEAYTTNSNNTTITIGGYGSQSVTLQTGSNAVNFQHANAVYGNLLIDDTNSATITITGGTIDGRITNSNKSNLVLSGDIKLADEAFTYTSWTDENGFRKGRRLDLSAVTYSGATLKIAGSDTEIQLDEDGTYEDEGIGYRIFYINTGKAAISTAKVNGTDATNTIEMASGTTLTVDADFATVRTAEGATTATLTVDNATDANPTIDTLSAAGAEVTINGASGLSITNATASKLTADTAMSITNATAEKLIANADMSITNATVDELTANAAMSITNATAEKLIANADIDLGGSAHSVKNLEINDGATVTTTYGNDGGNVVGFVKDSITINGGGTLKHTGGVNSPFGAGDNGINSITLGGTSGKTATLLFNRRTAISGCTLTLNGYSTIGSAAAAGAVQATEASGRDTSAVLDFTGNNKVTVSGTDNTINAALRLRDNTTTTFEVNNTTKDDVTTEGSVVLNGDIFQQGSSGSLTKSGDGKLTIASTSAGVANMSVTGGTLEIANGKRLTATGTMTVGAGSTLALNSANAFAVTGAMTFADGAKLSYTLGAVAAAETGDIISYTLGTAGSFIGVDTLKYAGEMQGYTATFSTVTGENNTQSLVLTFEQNAITLTETQVTDVGAFANGVLTLKTDVAAGKYVFGDTFNVNISADLWETVIATVAPEYANEFCITMEDAAGTVIDFGDATPTVVFNGQTGTVQPGATTTAGTYSVPEPTTATLSLLALAALAARRRRK